MSKPDVATSRRKFLITLGAGSATAAAAVVAAVAPESESPAAETDKPAESGYKVTEHINKYYRTTRV